MSDVRVLPKTAAPDTAEPLARVCIAIPTFQRPELLERLLCAVAGLRRPEHCDLAVLVMDNDPAATARGVFARLESWFPFRLSYAIVAAPGLASVRNFALAHVRRGFDFLAMLDDDEIPQTDWLYELLRAAQETGADGAVGPVPQMVPADAPRWLRKGAFFALPTYADRAPVRDGYSGNCLFRVGSLLTLGVKFDTAFNFSGGEDLMFFRELFVRGAKVVYAARAVAEEPIDPKRLNASYIIRLNFRRGNTLSRCDRRLGAPLRTLGLRAGKSLARAVRGTVTLLPYCLLDGRAGVVAAVADVAHGLGGLAGLLGHTYEAYDRSDRANA